MASYSTGEGGAYFDFGDLADHPASPPVGTKRLYALAGALYVKDALGVTTQCGGSGGQLPVGTIYHAYVVTDPATLLGYGTWARIGVGRVLVGQNAGDADFLTIGLTGGAKTVAAAGSNSAPTFTGTPFSSVINHTHTVTVTDPGHAHATPSQTATTGVATSYEHGVIDTSSTDANEGETTASATTGITAVTANPAGGVASITPAGSVSAPTFSGTATSVVQPYEVVYIWRRTA